ncbi:spermatogenesis-associated protein 6 [Rhinophrynus dorsalis]
MMQRQNHIGNLHHSAPVRKTCTFRTSRSYEQPTIASKSRSPSPYTKRRMCELSEDASQRLAHLNLGPYRFKKETDNKPPFVVQHVVTMGSSQNTTLPSCSPKGNTRVEELSKQHSDTSFLGSYTPKDSKISRKLHLNDLEGSLDNLNDHLLRGPASRPFHSTRFSMSHSAPPSVHKHPPSPLLNRSSLRERFESEQRASANWEEIHERVKNMLRTHRARQRLDFDKSVQWKDEPLTPNTLCNDSLCVSDLQDSLSFPLEKSVHLDNGEYWCNRAALYKGKSHRAVFEESLEKIYRNMYRNASDPDVYKKLYNS